MNVKRLLTYLFIINLAALARSDTYSDVNFHVVDQDGVDVEDATVSVTFRDTALNDYLTKSSKTDTKGHVVLSGPVEYMPAGKVEKEGYYTTRLRKIETWTRDRTGEIVYPELDLEVVLKRKVNPIPMLSRRVNVWADSFNIWSDRDLKYNTEIGFDFLEGDYVKPMGRGVYADVVLSVNFERSEDLKGLDARIEAKFSNRDDGVILFESSAIDGSNLRSAHLAPEEDYENRRVFERFKPSDGPLISNTSNTRCYYFRIRSKRNVDGELISAMYGKMYGDLNKFVYYLNPNEDPKDRNIEYDPQQNLFKLDQNKNIYQP